MRSWLAMMMLPALACQDDIVSEIPSPQTEAPTFEERCGVAGPVELLALAPREHAFRLDWSPDDQRMLVGVFRAAGALGLFADTSNRAIVSVGPCGEDPMIIGEGMEVVREYQGVALACAVDGSALFRIDPSGAADPVRILDGTCAVRRTDAGLVAVLPSEDNLGRLVIVREPHVLAPAVETLVEGVGVPVNVFFGAGDYRTTPLWAKGREAIAMKPDGDVISVNLDDGSSTVVVGGALEFRASSDGTKIVWQTDEAPQGDPDAPISAIFLHDRESSTGVRLLDSHLAWTVSPFRRDWVVVRDNSLLGQRAFAASGEELRLPEGTAIRAVLANDLFWLVRKADQRTEELLWDLEGVPRVIIDHAQGAPSKSGDGISVFVDAEHPAELEGALWYGPFDGGPVRLLSERVNYQHAIVSDGRILGIVEKNNNAHGRLLLENPADHSLIELDRYGYLHSPSLNAGDPFDGDIVYSVDDPEGTRHALYRAAVR
ncbi:MAG: hypothetical protein JKY37_24280 [Nannocystaceae bacterium]|nr:hypothetical protein [Nannocystaceae bacterium]